MNNRSKAKPHIYYDKWKDGCDELDEHTFGLIGSLTSQSISVKQKSLRSDVNVSVSKDRPI